MSQAKVDRYKKEKKNRGKVQKRKKAAKAVWVLIGAACVGGLIGVPLGKTIYQKSVETRRANETITASMYTYWMDEYWATNISATLNFTPSADELEDLLGTVTDATASETDAQ